MLLERCHAIAARAYVAPSNVGWIHLGLGEIDEASAWMDKAIDARPDDERTTFTPRPRSRRVPRDGGHAVGQLLRALEIDNALAETRALVRSLTTLAHVVPCGKMLRPGSDRHASDPPGPLAEREESMRFATLLALIAAFACSPRAHAQAPRASPLVMNQPATPRTTALGNAWVAGRDHEVVFYNPAQLIGARAELDVSVARIGSDSTMATFGSAYAAGKWSLTLGWGVQVLRFSAAAATPYPYASDVVLSSGPVDGFSSLFVVGGAVAFKGFRLGAAGKYVMESGSPPFAVPGSALVSRGALVADIGVARDLWGGVIAGSLQNLGGSADDGTRLAIPKQALIGWSTTRQAGPLDLGIVTQVTLRDEWTSPAAGLEVGYSWIEGYNIACRVGVRRPETAAEFPLAFGAAFTADRLTIEYAVRFFDGGRTANGVTVRWR